MAWEALQRIGALYAIEAEGKELSIDARQQLRRNKVCPNFKSSMTGSYRPVSALPNLMV
jgi:hypothetical protein